MGNAVHVVTDADRKAALKVYRRLAESLHDSDGAITSVDDLIQRISAVLGRPIETLELPTSVWIDDDPHSFVTGIVLARRAPHSHIIIVRSDVHGRHRDHIVAHELAHLLFRHHLLESEATDDGFDATSPTTRLRCSLDQREEREAEAFADLVCTRLLVPQNARDRGRYNWAH